MFGYLGDNYMLRLLCVVCNMRQIGRTGAWKSHCCHQSMNQIGWEPLLQRFDGTPLYSIQVTPKNKHYDAIHFLYKQARGTARIKTFIRVTKLDISHFT